MGSGLLCARRGQVRTLDLARGRRTARGAGTVSGAWDGWLAPRGSLAACSRGSSRFSKAAGTHAGTRAAGCALAGMLQPCVPQTRHHSLRSVALPGFPDDCLACSVQKQKSDQVELQPLHFQIKLRDCLQLSFPFFFL